MIASLKAHKEEEEEKTFKIIQNTTFFQEIKITKM